MDAEKGLHRKRRWGPANAYCEKVSRRVRRRADLSERCSARICCRTLTQTTQNRYKACCHATGTTAGEGRGPSGNSRFRARRKVSCYMARRPSFGLCFAIALVMGSVAARGGAALASPGTLWVNDDDPNGGLYVAPGTSCDDPGYQTIQSAVMAAAPGDRINVCPGTYVEEVTIPAG